MAQQLHVAELLSIRCAVHNNLKLCNIAPVVVLQCTGVASLAYLTLVGSAPSPAITYGVHHNTVTASIPLVVTILHANTVTANVQL
jgi:hypothetical protein